MLPNDRENGDMLRQIATQGSRAHFKYRPVCSRQDVTRHHLQFRSVGEAMTTRTCRCLHVVPSEGANIG